MRKKIFERFLAPIERCHDDPSPHCELRRRLP
jgi:hypothetical protein